MLANTGLKGKNQIKLLLVRPPGHLWPLINESDNWLMPLGLPCIAAYLRREIKGIDIKILDCLPEKIGWKSLERAIVDYTPDVFGVGDMLIYMQEGMRAVSLAKKINPDVVTIAGGHAYSHLTQYSLENFPDLDYIVRYEGEETTRELLETLVRGGDLSTVRSIAYRNDGKIVETPIRPLIADIDTLPRVAYDLMPVGKYSPYGKMFKKAITIQGNRGCAYNCSFCAWTALEGHHETGEDGKTVVVPTIRQRRADFVIEDIDYLYHQHGIRYLFWAEGTWNYNNEWMEEFCEKILSRNYNNLGWWAFCRADKLLEQEKTGLLSKMVKAGLRHALIGGERPVDEELQFIGKNKLTTDALLQASHLLKRKYPQVVRFATFMTGLPSETPESMMRLSDYSIKAKLDFAPFHPLTPFPGTPLYDEYQAKGLIKEKDFSKFDMFHPIIASENMTREEISHWTLKIQNRFIAKQPFHYLGGIFSPHKLRRTLRVYLLLSVLKVILRDLWLSLKGEKLFEGFGAVEKLWKPKWYDS